MFLIDHRGHGPSDTFAVASTVHERCPTLHVGVNLLVGPVCAAERVAAALDPGDVAHLDAVWCDDICGGDPTMRTAAEVHSLFTEGPLGAVTLFGGVAFKHTDRYTDDPTAAALGARMLAGYAPWCTDVLVASSLETEPYSGVLRTDRLTEMFDATQDLVGGGTR